MAVPRKGRSGAGAKRSAAASKRAASKPPPRSNRGKDSTGSYTRHSGPGYTTKEYADGRQRTTSVNGKNVTVTNGRGQVISRHTLPLSPKKG